MTADHALILGVALLLALLAIPLVDHYRDKSRQLDNDINRILDDHDREES